jgi:isopenicillin N synthase-like dioxygenase
MTGHIPIVDVTRLSSEDQRDWGQVAAEIGAACRGIGFFYIIGHGVPGSLIKDAFHQSEALFALGAAQKDAMSMLRSRHNRGYVGFAAEALDPSKPPDLKEAFNIGLDLDASDPEVLENKPFRGVNLWPELPGFRKTMLAYFDAVWQAGRNLHRAFAIDLQLTPAFFEDKLDRPMATLRVLHYPPMPGTIAQGQLGAGEHTDYGNVTLLAPGEAGGLEVRTRRGDWIAAPVIPGAFVCNIGDCLMRWTNGVYLSTPHRVVNPKGLERYSIAFFLDPNPEAEVACLPSCVSPERPPLYPPVRADDFLRSRLDPSYAHSRA